jgi:hypothetical protein
MTEPSNSALYTALAYHRAWTNHDFDQAMIHIAPDIVCQAPAGPVIGADAFRAFMAPFSELLIRSELIAAFGDTQTAVLIYNTETAQVKNAPAAEYHTVQDNQIVQMTIIFDRTPFDAAHRAGQRS